MQRLHICVGVADALEYIHYDAFEYEYIIHNNVNSSKILLDHNWEPKLHGFRSASKVKKHHLDLTNSFYDKLEYKDPAYEKTRGFKHQTRRRLICDQIPGFFHMLDICILTCHKSY
ncbi:putative non-specific serine/threonine protein kinase [Helianthus anomalus]